MLFESKAKTLVIKYYSKIFLIQYVDFRKLLLSTLAYTVQANLACTEVLEQWYPTVQPCAMALTCSGDFACVVELPEEAGGCATFTCKSDNGCPVGTTYYPFYPTIDEDAGEQISASVGYACYPPDEVPSEMFACEFDSNDFSLVVNAQVPEINKKHSYDDRNITLISWDAYLSHNDTGPWLLFDQVDCRGVVDRKLWLNYFTISFHHIQNERGYTTRNIIRVNLFKMQGVSISQQNTDRLLAKISNIVLTNI